MKQNFPQPVAAIPVKLGEWTRQELGEDSGIWDTDRQLTNLEAIRLIEEANGGQNIHTTQNGHTSHAGNEHNSQLTRASGVRGAAPAAEYVVSVLATRPPTNLHR